MVSGTNTISRDGRMPDAPAGEVSMYEVQIDLNLCGGDYFMNFGVAIFKTPD